MLAYLFLIGTMNALSNQSKLSEVKKVLKIQLEKQGQERLTTKEIDHSIKSNIIFLTKKLMLKLEIPQEEKMDLFESDLESFKVNEIPFEKGDQFYRQLFIDIYPDASPPQKYHIEYKNKTAIVLYSQGFLLPIYRNTLDAGMFLNNGEDPRDFRTKVNKGRDIEKSIWKFHIPRPLNINTKKGQEVAGMMVSIVESVLNREKYSQVTYKVLASLQKEVVNPGQLIAIYVRKDKNWHEMIQDINEEINKYKDVLGEPKMWQKPLGDRPLYPFIYARNEQIGVTRNLVGTYMTGVSKEDYSRNNKKLNEYDTNDFLDETYGQVAWSHGDNAFVLRKDEPIGQEVVYNPVFNCDDYVLPDQILDYFFPNSKESKKELTLRLRCVKFSLSIANDIKLFDKLNEEGKKEKIIQQTTYWDTEGKSMLCEEVLNKMNLNQEKEVDRHTVWFVEVESLKDSLSGLVDSLRLLTIDVSLLNFLQVNKKWFEINQNLENILKKDRLSKEEIEQFNELNQFVQDVMMNAYHVLLSQSKKKREKWRQSIVKSNLSEMKENSKFLQEKKDELDEMKKDYYQSLSIRFNRMDREKRTKKPKETSSSDSTQASTHFMKYDEAGQTHGLSIPESSLVQIQQHIKEQQKRNKELPFEEKRGRLRNMLRERRSAYSA